MRARFCELLGSLLGYDENDVDLFLVGMLSAVDALVGRPMNEILDTLSLSDEGVTHRARDLTS